MAKKQKQKVWDKQETASVIGHFSVFGPEEEETATDMTTIQHLSPPDIVLDHVWEDLLGDHRSMQEDGDNTTDSSESSPIAPTAFTGDESFPPAPTPSSSSSGGGSGSGSGSDEPPTPPSPTAPSPSFPRSPTMAPALAPSSSSNNDKNNASSSGLNRQSYGIILLLVLGILAVFFAWWSCKAWRRRRERYMLQVQSDRADAVLGDMQMVPNDDYDDDPELL